MERTFFVTTVSRERRTIFKVERNAVLMLLVLRDYEAEGAFRLHAFVMMPDHLHLLLTPAPELSLERAMQRIKGGFSYRAREWLRAPLWQTGFMSHWIRDGRDFENHVEYINANPIRRGLCRTADRYPFSSASVIEVAGAKARFLMQQTSRP